MKPRLILMSHGHLARELANSAKMIIGETEGVYTVSMLESDGLEGTQGKLNAVLEEIGPDAPVLVCADLLSGTPCNVAVQAMYQRSGLRVLTGLNLAHHDGYRKIKKSVSLSDADIALIREILAKGVKVTAQMIPDESDASIETFLN
ncbi:MAG: PTS sugar transporter subunit IIB [Oscillospiraceae bacterium]|nr:PTS sugar transporter subunit IIB [Oscillospiraceae bacterium]